MHLTARLQRMLHQIRHSVASPARNPRLAVVIGRLLAVAFLICFATGLYSHFLQDPLPWMVFPTRPVWIYQLSQGVHITAGIACFPLLFAKLFTVFPELFQSPPVRSFAHLLERASIALFVGGIPHADHDRPAQHLSALRAVRILVPADPLRPVLDRDRLARDPYRSQAARHRAVLAHDAMPTVRRDRSSRTKRTRMPNSTCPTNCSGSRAGRRRTASPGGCSRGWTARPPLATPDRVRDTRRGFLTTIALATRCSWQRPPGSPSGSSTRSMPSRRASAASDPRLSPSTAPRRPRASSRPRRHPSGRSRSSMASRREVYTRSRLQALPQRDVVLPIACVEGWSQDAAVARPAAERPARLRRGRARRPRAHHQPADEGQLRASPRCSPEFSRDPLTLVALELFGEQLDIDHGYPARIIAPGRPGVLQTKWLSPIEVIA